MYATQRMFLDIGMHRTGAHGGLLPCRRLGCVTAPIHRLIAHAVHAAPMPHPTIPWCMYTCIDNQTRWAADKLCNRERPDGADPVTLLLLLLAVTLPHVYCAVRATVISNSNRAMRNTSPKAVRKAAQKLQTESTQRLMWVNCL